ncbi:MAG TPA: TlpA disulfide reductase family protein [Dongiaceae bacterium]|nr:TlpA disulfide reductase family protein [Dongiaceae bacterium]
MKTALRNSRWAGVLTGLLLSVTLVHAALPQPGETFPNLNNFGLEGAVPDLTNKVVLVDFFASWCGPCQESFPVMERLYQQYGKEGLVVVAINLDKKKEDMQDFLKAHPVTFVVLRDGSFSLAKQLKIPTMPTSFLLDRSGRVHSIHQGFKGGKTADQYTQEIGLLLKTPRPSSP